MTRDACIVNLASNKENVMNYRSLGRTGLKVSELCLGTMQWGWTADEAASVDVMDAFVAAGGNFVDTADVYSFWAEGNPGGVSEQIIGRWMKERGNRQQIVLATKVRGRMWPGPNGEGLSRVHILQACEDSLRRLQTDYIDLYQTHWYDAETPIDETMEALDALVRAGKVRYVGCSNYPAWRLMQALWASDKRNLVRFDSIQPHYSLVHRAEFERELKDVCLENGLGVIPYSPLAGGFLTGKYRRDTAAQSARAEGIRNRYMNDKGFAVLDELDKIAAEHGATVAQVALAWQMTLPWVTAPIVGANTVAQLGELVGACAVKLSAQEMERLNGVSAWE
jgi:aryl-alcohol dehydrogenase-like predicted oxidoreductase